MAGFPARQHDSEEFLVRNFAKVAPVALGIACGTVMSFAIFAATAILLLRGGEAIGPHLSLLGQYFPGYDVTWRGSVLGFFYGFVAGFSAGWLVAFLRNACLAVYLYTLKLWANLTKEHFLDRFDN